MNPEVQDDVIFAEMSEAEQIQLRIRGDASCPTLVYLPGLHGDWTLVGSFRRALGDRVRFVEVTYPRTLTWSVQDYAMNVEQALAEKGITSGWLLGESFSSVVVWPLIERKRFKVEGLILAGGFVEHSMRWGARLLQRVAGAVPLSLVTRIFFTYAKVARFRYRRSPETRADIGEFIARRTELDRRAAVHRLQLVAESDPRAIARKVSVPVFALSGAVDPIVPWMLARRSLRKNCSVLREYKIFWRADHNVLSTAADAAADKVVGWIKQARNAKNGAPKPG
ncbi:MAG TPA: alpha/beta hydrolase [Verrucomicrobiae bacterium]|nr:alpha/beta hydrolase [Verrucomicrobiae bacterium]